MSSVAKRVVVLVLMLAVMTLLAVTNDDVYEVIMFGIAGWQIGGWSGDIAEWWDRRSQRTSNG